MITLSSVIVCVSACECITVGDLVQVRVIPVKLTRHWWLLRGGGSSGGGGGGLETVAGLGVGTWTWGGRIPSSNLRQDRGWRSWGGRPSRGASRLSELRPWLSTGPTVMAREGGSTGGGGGADKGCRMKCSRRVWILSGSLTFIFITSLLFSISIRGGVGFNYLEPPGWEESRRVKLVPSYIGAHRLLPADIPQQKTCACPRCVGDPGVSEWFDENYDPDVSPVWTKDNLQLPSDVYYWWVVSNNKNLPSTHVHL